LERGAKPVSRSGASQVAPTGIQQIDPWMSEEEIKSGSPWEDAVGTSLDQSHFGLICVTGRTNNPWLLFEAGPDDM
jgi:hypothetical protein